MSVQTSGFDEWLATLNRAADQAIVASEGRKVVEKGCVNIKDDWRKRWTGLARLPHLPRTIGYDVDVTGTTITGEVGPDSNKLQGVIAPVIEYGSIHNAPRPGGAPALDAEKPRFAKAIEDLGERLLT